MKLTKTRLKQLIREELQHVLAEKPVNPKWRGLDVCLSKCEPRGGCEEDMGAGEGNSCRRQKRKCEVQCKKMARAHSIRSKIKPGTGHTP